MGKASHDLKTQLQQWGGRILLTLVVVVCSPLLLSLLLAYGLYALLLHFLLWMFWEPGR